MTFEYSHNNLFHFTSFENAIKIIVSNKFIFGRLDKVNDIAEANPEVYAQFDYNLFVFP